MYFTITWFFKSPLTFHPSMYYWVCRSSDFTNESTPLHGYITYPLNAFSQGRETTQKCKQGTLT